MTQIRFLLSVIPRPLGERVWVRGVPTLALVLVLLLPGCKKPNHAPDTPSVPSGPTSCAVDLKYRFHSALSDPDGDDVSVRFDWGDGDTSPWSEYSDPRDLVHMYHAWSSIGSYTVRAQAREQYSIVTAWSDGLGLSVYYEWAKAIGGEDANNWGESVQQTHDGGYVVTGATARGPYDAWLLRVDAHGDTVWSATPGGAAGHWGCSVQQTRDSGFVVAGVAWVDIWRSDALFVKLDANGREVWRRFMGGTGEEEFHSVVQTRDGGYAVTGYTVSYGAGASDVWLVKTDANGDTVWTRTFGGTGFDAGNSVQETQDGGYVITGLSGSCIWLFKTDGSGNTVWDRKLGGAAWGGGNSVVQTQDGGYAIAGGTKSHPDGRADVFLAKTNRDGDTAWTRTFGGAGDDWGNQLCQTRDGGFIVVAYTKSFGAGKGDMWLLKTDANGDTVWTRTFGGPEDDCGRSVQTAQDGGYIVAGTTSSSGQWTKLWLVKTGANGEVDSVGGK